jgi:hypothetical protein
MRRRAYDWMVSLEAGNPCAIACGEGRRARLEMEGRSRRYPGRHHAGDYRTRSSRAQNRCKGGAPRCGEGGGIVEKGAGGIPTMDVKFSSE